MPAAEIVNKRLASDAVSPLSAVGEAVPDDIRIFQRLAALNLAERPQIADAYVRRVHRLTGLPPPPSSTPPPPSSTSTPPSAPTSPAATLPDTKALAETLFLQAEQLRKGEGRQRDPVAALGLYRRAAALGHPSARHRLGVLYATGDGVPKSDEEAVRWYQLAAEQGFAEAQYDLGVRYILGKGVQKNETIGLDWYRKAALQGYQPAIDLLRKRGRWP